MNRDVRVGCCGFRRARADYYARFAAVEVQHTFYDPPQTKTLKGWRAEAPDGFEFTLKAWQLITHGPNSPTYKRMRRDLDAELLSGAGNFAPTDAVRLGLETTLEAADALKASCVVFQCPARFTAAEENIENMRLFFSHRRPKGLRYAWEPRGAWPEALVQSVCEELDLIHVVDPFARDPLTRGTYYFRVLGKRGRGFEFTDEQLAELAEAMPDGERTYVFFNHLAMLTDAGKFRGLIDGAAPAKQKKAAPRARASSRTSSRQKNV